MTDNSVKVVFRFRGEPPNAEVSEWVITGEGKSLQLGHAKNPDRKFEFDAVLGPEVNQETVYEKYVKESIDQFMKGFNSTIFAYGQTASGKTYSMVGPEEVVEQLMKNAQNIPEQVATVFGIIPRSILTIFTMINDGITNGSKFVLKCSYLEVYNETIQDILTTPVALNLKGLFVQGAEERFITTPEQIFECLAIGQKNRSVCATGANARSSRSHTVFILFIEQKTADGVVKMSKLNLVDLAGSEKLSKAQTTGQQLEETKKINQSLTCLGMCIMALTAKKKQHIPYRDSKLTMLLKESLGGNSKTLMMCTGSLRMENEEETLSSLRFAQRAKCIQNKARQRVKRTMAEMEALVEALKKEVAHLRALLKQAGVKVGGNKEIDGEMEDVEEVDVEDIQTDEDLQVRFTELQAKYDIMCEQKEHEMEQARSVMGEELRGQVDELEKEVQYRRSEVNEQKERLNVVMKQLEECQLSSQDEIEGLRREIERLKREISELNERLREAESGKEQLVEQVQRVQQEQQQIVQESRQLQQSKSGLSVQLEEQSRLVEELQRQIRERVEQVNQVQRERDQYQVQLITLNEKKESLEKQIVVVKQQCEQVVVQKEQLQREKSEQLNEHQQEMRQVKEESRQAIRKLEELQSSGVKQKEVAEKEQELRTANELLVLEVEVLRDRLRVETEQIRNECERVVLQTKQQYEVQFVELEHRVIEYKEKYVVCEEQRKQSEQQYKTVTVEVDRLRVEVQEKEVLTKELKQEIVEIHHTREVVELDQNKINQEYKEKYEADINRLIEERNRIKKDKEELQIRYDELYDELTKLKKSQLQSDNQIAKKTDEIIQQRNEINRLETINKQNLDKLKDQTTQLASLKQQLMQKQNDNAEDETFKNAISKPVLINSNLFGQHMLRRTNNAFMQKAREEAERAQKIFDEMNQPKQSFQQQQPQQQEEKKQDNDKIPSPINAAKAQQIKFDLSDVSDDDNAELN